MESKVCLLKTINDMIIRKVFAKLIRAVEEIHDLDEIYKMLLVRNPDIVIDVVFINRPTTQKSVIFDLRKYEVVKVRCGSMVTSSRPYHRE
jgi:hypothetical protein